jgi:hypothetical protein
VQQAAEFNALPVAIVLRADPLQPAGKRYQAGTGTAAALYSLHVEAYTYAVRFSPKQDRIQ